MAVSITNTTIAALNTDQTATANAATSTATGGGEVFTYTPKANEGKSLLVFNNLGSTSIHDYSIAAGDLWGAKAITGTVAASAVDVLQVDTSRVMTDDGTILITVTPSTGASSTTNLAGNAFKMYAMELL